MDFKVSKVRHPKEKFYGSVILVSGIIGWLIAAGAILFAAQKNPAVLVMVLIYIGGFWFAGYIVRALLRAHMMGHYVMVSEQQFPHLHKMVEDGARLLGLNEARQCFVYNSSGVMNAMALRLVGRTRYIWLTSQLIDADDEDQVKFVIGHELGHHVAGHLNTISVLLHLPGHLVPFLGQAYSRARELTCDRIGLVVSGDLRASRTALQMLACGSARLNAQMNPAAFEAQERMVPSTAGFILHIFSHYPRLTRRVKALGEWSPDANNSAASELRQSAVRVEPQLS